MANRLLAQIKESSNMGTEKPDRKEVVPPKEAPADKPRRVIRFTYQRAEGFRTFHVDGVTGGLTPNGNFHVALFAERGNLPLAVVHELEDNDTLGREVGREGAPGILRELQCELIMPIEMAKAFASWLNEQLKQADRGKG